MWLDKISIETWKKQNEESSGSRSRAVEAKIEADA
jgi:hypothetical protein